DTDTPFAPLRLRIPGVVFMPDLELVGRLRRKSSREKARQIRRRFAAVKDERPVVHAIDTPLRGGVRITVRIAERARQELGRRLCHLPDRSRRPVRRIVLGGLRSSIKCDTDTPFAPLRLRVPGVVFMPDLELDRKST